MRLSWGASPAYLWNLSHPGTSGGSLKRCATRRGPPFLKVGVALIPPSCGDHPENSFHFRRPHAIVRLLKLPLFIFFYLMHEWRANVLLCFSQLLGKLMKHFGAPGARKKSESSVWAPLSPSWPKSTCMPDIPDLHQSLIMLLIST